ncbi:hypothetical protein N7541_010053 [Penicillium brevicompactum]|uniref:C2H2-type domain-containing protein n=1 Tax=Penicillium brevicompactum TaxID=5074 RepID=A0A9W9QQ81_PENBR|nr:hypothetical protein N7541_010053 [Penicillium brevicompactum]
MPSNSDTNTTAMFKCNYSGCNASYQRKEHLRRHQIKHSQQQIFPCSNCDQAILYGAMSGSIMESKSHPHEPSERVKAAELRNHVAKEINHAVNVYAAGSSAVSKIKEMKRKKLVHHLIRHCSLKKETIIFRFTSRSSMPDGHSSTEDRLKLVVKHLFLFNQW